MKNKTTSRPLISPITLIFFKHVLSSLALIFSLILFISCEQNSSKGDLTQATISNGKVHVAFAGGGWRAHTGHSAWTISLLDKGTKKLKDVFSNVGTISSNSGGSWYSTMLTFSDDFVSEIEAKDAVDIWTTDGWIGKQRNLFKSTGCTNDLGDYAYLECVFDTYTGKNLTGGTYWKLMVEKLVYNDYSLGSTTLNGKRQPWAVDKPLLLASSLLNNSVVLNIEDDKEGNHRYYQACFSPSKPVLDGDTTADCTNGLPMDVTPATFSSIPKGSNLKPSPFLPELGTDTKSSKINLGYTADYLVYTAPKCYADINLPLHNENVNVMAAAAASSAATGFGASERITGLFDLSYTMEDDAISFSLADSKVKYMEAKGMKVDTLAKKKMIRLVDGGALDNTGVIQLVRSLQLNDQSKDFSIVAFDNTTTLYKNGKDTSNVGVDIANFFGYSSPLCVDLKLIKYCFNLPSVQIFEKNTLFATDTLWTHGSKGANQLIYTKYSVKTTANPVMGVSAGNKGTLHLFTCIYPDADTAPTKGKIDFDTYDDMFKFINSGLTHKGGEGLKHLQTALGQ